MQHIDIVPVAASLSALVPDEGLTGNAEAGSFRCAAAAPATVSGEAVLDTPLVRSDREGEHRRRSVSQETCQHSVVAAMGRGALEELVMTEPPDADVPSASSHVDRGSGKVAPSVRLSICFRCKPEGWSGDADTRRPGADLADAIEAEATRRGIDLDLLRDVRCMSQCKRPCVVAFSGEGRFTYLFGDLDPTRDAPAVLDAFMLYAERADGFMERFERPDVMREGILGRVPPLTPGARQVERRPAPVEST